jgi:uroporphyrin-III C-methyltransferase
MLFKKKVHKLRIVGAGPGDPELITVKGAMAIQEAEVILHDALVDTRLLDNYAQPGTKRVYVGKRLGKKEFSQDEINELIVFYALKYNNVVRLKGGDPFVYGRGHEELEFAVSKGIDVEVIPGISSSIAAPSAAGIPLTKRNVNESFWVVTGMLADGDISGDIYHAARSTATVIIMMGVTHLSKIASIFSECRGAEEPIAIIRYATWEEEEIFSGSVSNIDDVVAQKGITSPAVIVIGKVVNESLLLKKINEAKSQYIQA